jgi:hypothetical protein
MMTIYLVQTTNWFANSTKNLNSDVICTTKPKLDLLLETFRSVRMTIWNWDSPTGLCTSKSDVTDQVRAATTSICSGTSKSTSTLKSSRTSNWRITGLDLEVCGRKTISHWVSDSRRMRPIRISLAIEQS